MRCILEFSDVVRRFCPWPRCETEDECACVLARFCVRAQNSQKFSGVEVRVVSPLNNIFVGKISLDAGKATKMFIKLVANTLTSCV